MTIKKNIVLFIFLFFAHIFFSQKKVDSLLKVIALHPNDTVGARAYFNINNFYMGKGMIDTAWLSIKKGYDFSKKIKYKRGIAASGNYIAQYYNYHGNLDSSVYYFTLAKDLYAQLGDSSRMSGMINNIGVAYKSRGHISRAMDFYFSGFKKLKNVFMIVKA